MDKVNVNFQQAAANVSKAGAYYTDGWHAFVIGGKVKFVVSEKGKVNMLEPSAGDGNMIKQFASNATYVVASNSEEVKTVKGAEDMSYARLYAVELNQKTFEEHLKENPLFEKAVCCDFLDGLRNAFDKKFETGYDAFVANPPYLEEGEGECKERTEFSFLKKATSLLKVGGLLVYIIPERIFKSDQVVKHLLRNYEIDSVYKFKPEEYAKWKQVVVYARKKAVKEITIPVNDYLESVKDIPVLPDAWKEDEEIQVECSGEKNVVLFEPKNFNINEAFDSFLANQEQILQEFKPFHKAVNTPEFRTNTLRDPLTTMCEGHIAQAVCSGEGCGLTGTPGIDEHLQRGVCEVKETVQVESDTDESANARKSRTGVAQKVTTSSKVEVCTISCDGTIRIYS